MVLNQAVLAEPHKNLAWVVAVDLKVAHDAGDGRVDLAAALVEPLGVALEDLDAVLDLDEVLPAGGLRRRRKQSGAWEIAVVFAHHADLTPRTRILGVGLERASVGDMRGSRGAGMAWVWRGFGAKKMREIHR